MTRPALLVTALLSAAALATGLSVGPAVAAPEAARPDHPWQYPHWPRQQPWQQQPSGARIAAQAGFPAPVDPQNWVNPDHMTWEKDYKKVPGTNWADPQPGPDGLSGVNVEMGTGDLAPACDVATNPFCDGGGYHNYTVEVVDRMGADSFTPDAGVLLAKTKNQDNAPFEWVIDANPQDIGMTDYVLPDGTEVPVTIGDYRQLSDALYHAGTGSGSEYEYVDETNRLHFYVLDVKRDSRGVLSYTVAIRSFDGAGPQERGVKVLPTFGLPNRDGLATCEFPVFNTGRAASASGHPEDVSKYLNGDVYRVSATVDGQGWAVSVPNALATASFGRYVQVPVHAKKDGRGPRVAEVRLTATSESDPSKTATATCVVVGR